MANRKQKQMSDLSDTVFYLNPLSACVKAALAGNLLIAFASPVSAELPVPSPVWNSMGGATREVVGNTMNINQLSDRVILNWEKFNISADSAVNFRQKPTDIALNKIHDQNPSQILGSLTADGQIYLVNPNGILFGRNSTVNVRGIVAATMNVTIEDTFDKETINTAYLKDKAAFEGSGEFYHKDASGNFKLDAAGNKIPIQIEIADGAKISAADGGRIMILAPSIVNRGEVDAPNGQVIMAAATDKVYLQQAPYGDDTQENSDVRGLLVEVKTGGKVENLGKISADRGNVTLMGYAVNQDGRVSATTAANVNGTIRLLAREGANVVTDTKGLKQIIPATTIRTNDNGDDLGTSAKVTFGVGSKTEIMPDLNAGLALDSENQPNSRVEVMAHKIHMKSGSSITAPSGDVKFTATKNPVNPVAENTQNDSRILLDSGSTIDVSGTDYVVKPMESNVIEVQLRNFELADAPLQKNGILKGETIKVDIREGTPLTNIQPTVAQIQRSVAERLSKGGSIELNSEGDAIVEQGAVLDFSGGAVTFLDGIISTTTLIAKGRLIDISDADPFQTYEGIFGRVDKYNEKFNQTQTWFVDPAYSLDRFEKGYVDGKDAGSLFIKANTVILNGDLRGGVISGRLQRDLLERARAGRLVVDSSFTFSNEQSIVFSANLYDPLNVDIDELLQKNENNVPMTLAMNADKLFESGIGDATFITNGQITVDSNARVNLIDGGALTLRGGAIDIKGDIVGSGASVDLSTKISDSGKLDGDINLFNGAEILLQGQWVNDYAQPENLLGKSLAINGGSFNAKVAGTAGGNLRVASGSRVNVGGGGWVQTDGTLVAGEAGAISLAAEPSEDSVGANVILDGLFEGYGLRQGGRFTVVSNAVAIRREDMPDASDEVKPLQIATDFFNKGGFSEFDIGSNMNGLTVEAGANITLSQTNKILNNDFLFASNAADIERISTQTTLEPLLRQSSSLILRASHAVGVNDESLLKIENGASIVADNLSSIKLESDSSVVMDGRIVAQGGNLSINIIPDSRIPNYVASQGIWLGDNAKIDLSGTSNIVIDNFGRRNGLVYDGGNFVVDANRGFFAAKSGSSINVSGTEAVLDLPTASLVAEGFNNAATLIGSNAGRIDITSAEGVFLEGEMIAQAGQAPGAAGGSLSVNLNIDNRNDPDAETGSSYPSAPRTIWVSQQAVPTLVSGFQNPSDELPATSAGIARLAAHQVSEGGFSSLALAASGADGQIRFSGDVDLSLTHALALDAVKLGWEGVGGQVNLLANTATIGSDIFRSPSVVSNINKIAQNPVSGNGRFNLTANLIDLVGGTVTSGYDAVNLNSAGDIRLIGIRTDGAELDFVGEFKTYSKLVLTADQVYPTTLTNFTLGVKGDSNGSITVNPGGERSPVLSALGKLSLQAPNIAQNGSILAPLGELELLATNTINFGASSLTSVSSEGLTIPVGVTQGGQEWLFPLKGTGNNLNVPDPYIQNSDTDKKVILSSPQKKITVNADRIIRAEGAEVNLSGGGEMLAYEFIPGDGGSQDVLASNSVFAVLPGLSAYSPFDPKNSPDSGLKAADSIFIGEGSGLASGYYALLPARYALLEGAFLVTPLDTGKFVLPNSSRDRVDGTPIVAGYRAVSGSSSRDQYWSEYVVEPGEIAKTRSEYNLSFASEFFKTQAEYKELAIPRLAQDAGQLVLSAQTALELPDVVARFGQGGKGGLVDIIANNLLVVSNKTGKAGTVEILSSDIEKLGVDSLSLGAERTFDNQTNIINLDVKAKNVSVAENTTLKAPGVLLAATDSVNVKAGARIETEQTTGERPGKTHYKVTGDGALLILSTGEQATLERTGNAATKGELTIVDNAVISSNGGALLVDSTLHTSLDGELALAGGSLSIGAESINLGETTGISTGVSLDNSQLSNLALSELVLNSRGMVNLYGQLQQPGSNAPLQFGNLTINAAGLAGKNNAGKTAWLAADTLTLSNTNNAVKATGDGSGVLNINAGQLNLAAGQYEISGFNSSNLTASNGVLTSGTGTLASIGTLNLTTPFVSGVNGANTTIDASGHALTVAGGGEISLDTQGVSAQLDLMADSIILNSSLLYQAGQVGLNALQGDLVLGVDAVIDVSGKQVYAGLSAPVDLPAGNIKLVAQQGNVDATTGQLNLQGVKAGTLTAKAAQGQVSLGSGINARGSSKALGGSVVIDTQNSSAGGFAALNTLLANAGFTAGIDFRLRNGDITVESGQTVNANHIKLSADTGSITVAGALDARGDNGGKVELAAEDVLSLSGIILANAQATGGQGGKVSLSSIDNNIDGAGIAFTGNAFISVAGNGGVDGEVHLRTDRDGNDIAISNTAIGPIATANTVTAEAVKLYNFNSIGLIQQNTIDSDNADYINNLTNSTGFTILPGVEVRSSGNLTIADNWDFVTWRYGAENVPGVLTLRAAGNLNVNHNLSDGFVNPENDYVNASTPIYGVPVYDYLQTNASWTYSLVAGADLNAADSQAVVTGVGNIDLAADTSVRTGTGDISVIAGRDIRYGNQNSVIYTAGRADTNYDTRWGTGGEYFALFFYAEYPLDGGDINLNAGRDIIAKPSSQVLSDWLVRTGSWTANSDHSFERPTAWGVALGTVPDVNDGFSPQHQQSVAAFGGGNVSVVAGNNIKDLSVVIPTTGKQVGDKANTDPEDLAFNTNIVDIQGGGNLQVNAGGDIAGGVFYVDNPLTGTADISAFGSLKAGSNLNDNGQGLNPILATGGNTQFNVFAANNLALAAVVDPFFVTQPDGAVADIEGISNRFFRYGPEGTVNLLAVTGNITLENDLKSLNQATNVDVPESRFAVYPTSLNAYALNGDMNINNGMSLFPSTSGQLELYANNQIKGNAFVHLPDTEPTLLPSLNFPIQNPADVVLAYNFLDPFLIDKLGVHALTPLHQNDLKSALISTRQGNIGDKASNLSFTLAKPAEIMAGRDLFNTSLYIQNVRTDAVSMVKAGRDIRFPIILNPLNGGINLGDQVIEIAGPGDLVALAGRNVDLGAAQGILSIGDQNNAALNDSGASVSVFAGLAEGQPDAVKFADVYMKNSEKFVVEYQAYRQRLLTELKLLTNNDQLQDTDADAAYATLSEVNKIRVDVKLLSPVQSVFMKTISSAASASAKANFGYQQKWAELEILTAVETLFPGSTLLGEANQSLQLLIDPIKGVGISHGDTVAYVDSSDIASQNLAGNLVDGIYASGKERPVLGEVLLFLSTVQSQKGGEVSVFTPNGGINVGLATADIGLNKTPDQQGIIVKEKDNVNVVTRDDIAVNVQRIVAIGGGKIIAGSTESDVDAGRSPLTALAAPPLGIQWDESGMPVEVVKPQLAGGGIRTIKGPEEGEKAGDVVLFAPRGVINAGEAGIAGDNVTLASPIVLNSNFIQSNSTTGTPPAAGSVAPPTGVSNLAATVSKSVTDGDSFGNDDKTKGFAQPPLGMLSVEVLGFGET
ncbi:filamentous hemagglutinin [Methylomonas lenta]|uniref:Filamentous hemagglutinin n=1 Tax=Methylomonas lenta TaxID=980561 RepID=A0A177N1F6_9GAMM|nr:filamentous haemagglutinin family protein [Methylomonas lenta]OAI11681.1 filamentous hemagglutinin [Methylomonas lenta]